MSYRDEAIEDIDLAVKYGDIFIEEGAISIKGVCVWEDDYTQVYFEDYTGGVIKVFYTNREWRNNWDGFDWAEEEEEERGFAILGWLEDLLIDLYCEFMELYEDELRYCEEEGLDSFDIEVNELIKIAWERVKERRGLLVK